MSNRSPTNLDPTSSNTSSHGTIFSYKGTPNTPVQVLDPREKCYARFQNAWDRGELNPHYNGHVEGRYNTISSAYCSGCAIDTNYYTVRSGRAMAPSM